MAETANENDAELSSKSTSRDEQAFITVCSDCDYIDAVRAESVEELDQSGDDPAFHHYLETDHKVGSIPVEEFDADVLTEMIFDE